MKAIIIDDEKHVREGIQLLAEWHKYGIKEVFEAKDGEEAKTIINAQKPELVFTDMNMPNVDGIALLKWLDRLGYLNEVIVISGYDDYQYMRNAIYYGSFDYILKPIEPDVLNETLERAVTHWRERDQKQQFDLENDKVAKVVKPIYWDHLFSGIIDRSSVSEETLQKIKKEINVDIRNVPCTVALLHISFMIEQVFDRDEELAFFTLLNICNEYIGEAGVCFRNVNQRDQIVILLWDNVQGKSYIQKIHEAIYSFSARYCTTVVGAERQSVASAYHSAKETLLTFNLLNVKRWKQVVTRDKTDSRPVIHLLDYSQEISWALQSGSKGKIDEILDQLFQSMESTCNLSIKQLQIWEQQFEILKSNWLKEYQIDEPSLPSKRLCYWEEDGCFSFEYFQREKREDFYHLIDLLSDAKYCKSKSSIEEIAEYLVQHYDQDIKLQDIADHFYLSREYIARKFKQSYGDTVIGYLTNIRMEKAIDLLENPPFKNSGNRFKSRLSKRKIF
ncbi:two-component response regulator [Gracilibacillus boraciitolerans JCM 21714]|uniref:Two-component response regulator n=1 Tax=Gracilibacillus boraciitolerans JCM 21714 TaxID=1298598 RepID=W4VMT0_9BACI|nr:response regulator [Gracilibacillus boraciitolerans]GAE94492.1 two-component response regulator [Gracilibacillus boraciitolerans JCM 21714]